MTSIRCECPSMKQVAEILKDTVSQKEKYTREDEIFLTLFPGGPGGPASPEGPGGPCNRKLKSQQ